MSGAFFASSDAWDRIVLRERDRLGPVARLDADMLTLDVAYLIDRAIRPSDPKDFPTFDELRARWGTAWAKSSLSDKVNAAGFCVDPYKAAAWSAYWDALRVRRARGANRGERGVNGERTGGERAVNETERANVDNGEESERSVNGERTVSERRVNVVGALVLEAPDTQHPTPAPETETRAPVPVAVPVKPKRSASVAPEVAAVWSVYREEQAAIGSKRGESPPKGWGVAARVADPAIGADGMIAVIRWAHRSPHDRAKHLRDGGYLGDTLFRESKAPEYLPLALAWRDGTGPQPKPTGPGVLFGGSTFASKAEPAPTFPPPCRRWSNVLARLRLDGDAELVAAWLADSDLLDDRTVGVRTAHHVDWLTTAGGGLDPATEDMTAAIADALDVPRHRLRFVERPRVEDEVPA